MGNVSARPAEEAQRAVMANDVGQLTKVLRDVEAQGLPVAEVINRKDKEGRSLLMLAAARNHHHCARRLLEAGAAVHYINPATDSRGGTALHEATRRRHEAMAELLLQWGASPFQSNAVGKTCVDEAVLEGTSNLLRRYEQLAIWRGSVAVRLSRLGGISQPYKTRHIVLLPYISFPTAEAPSHVRCQMWIFKDAAALVPKSRVWLDGATATRTSSNDLLIRLHPTHKVPPGDLCTRFDRGYGIQLRIRDATVAAALDLDQLQALVVSGPALLQPRSGAAYGAGLAAAPSFVRVPSFMPALPSLNDSFSSAASVRLSAVPRAAPQHSPHGSVPALWVATAGSATAAVSVTAATEPPAYGSSSGRQVSAAFVDSLRALPGESDADFASRLASAVAVETGHDQAALQRSPSSRSPPPLSRASSRPTPPLSRASSRPTPPLSRASSRPTPPLSRASSRPTPPLSRASTRPTPPLSRASTPALAHHQAHAQVPLQMGFAHIFGATLLPATASRASSPRAPDAAVVPSASPPTTAGSMVAADGTPSPSLLPLPPLVRQQMANASGFDMRGTPASPSAPPLAQQPTDVTSPLATVPLPSGVATGGDASEERLCVVCLSAPREVGFLHGTSVHVSVCRECCDEFRPGSPCPLCRQRVERILNVF